MGSIQLGNYVIVDVDPQKIYGKKGLGLYRLSFDFKFDVYPKDEQEEETIVSNIRTEVFIYRRNQVEREKVYLGNAFPADKALILKTVPKKNKTHASFDLNLSKQQIDLIEELRNGEELVFLMNLICEVKSPNNHTSDSSEHKFYVNKSDWLKALKAMRYGNYLLFEIPIPDISSDIPEKVLKQLEDARDHFIKGYYEVTVSKCRNVFERLKNFRKDSDQIGKSTDLFCDGSRKSMNKGDRINFIRSGVHHFTHLAHHPKDDEEGNEITFTRQEARLLLAQTAALVSFYFED